MLLWGIGCLAGCMSSQQKEAEKQEEEIGRAHV